MKTPRLLLLLLTTAILVLLVSATAFAQDVPGPLANLTPVSGAALVVSILIGFIGNSVATGKILGQKDVPAGLVPVFTLGLPFLTGVGSVLKSATSFSGATIFNMVAMGAAAVVASCAGIAAHGHLQNASALPKLREALRAAAKAAGVLLCVGALASSQAACNQPLFPLLQKVEQVVLADLEQNKTPPQIDSDVCQALGGSATTDAICADVTTLITDAIEALIATGVIKSPTATGAAKAYTLAHPRGAVAPASAAHSG